MRLLLTGRNGQVGFELRRALAPLGDVAALDRTDCDLENEASIREVVRRFQPTVIVNPAAYTAVDMAENEEGRAQAINARAPAILGEEAAGRGSLVVHYSTDYVFDGNTEGYYQELDATGPQGVYGKTKLAGEQALIATGARHLIFRTSWVFGAHGANFAKTMLRLAAERKTLDVVADQIGAPTSAALIADITAHVIRQVGATKTAEFDGIYHLAAAGETNWHTYACHVIEYARLRGHAITVASEAIRPIATADYPTLAKRPANSRLATRKLRDTFGLVLPDWKVGVDHVLEQLIRGTS